MKRLHVIVRGRVQGVYFRASARDRARQLGVTGWVRNCADGSVELVAEGATERLTQLLTWCHGGPPGALVTDVEVHWQDATGEFVDFVIRR
ncbi:MAG: acylphosphatase [Candidatus Binatia bacterium]|nr:acylphosphatase [Candidatus Binatia bacterium]